MTSIETINLPTLTEVTSDTMKSEPLKSLELMILSKAQPSPKDSSQSGKPVSDRTQK